ncbi:MAG: RelA/SpoT AH/RIS domain-containing protein, partial [Pseudomonadota bacterium]
ISTPKPNNYRSLHTAVFGPEMQRIEMQIRTRKMHETAERGVAAHWRYKDPDLRAESGVSVEMTRGGGRKGHDPYRGLQGVVEMLDHGEDAEEFLENTKLELFRDQVFCFTPKGRLIDLPRGATPLDFAYAVHTRVGDTCVGARVNGQHVPLRTPLRNGDMVEVLRSTQSRPPANWESLVVTGKARSAIRRLLRASERKEFAKLGRDLAEAGFAKDGYQLTDKAVAQALENFKLDDLEAIYDRIGRSQISVEELLDAVYPGREKAHAPGVAPPPRKPCIGPKGSVGAVSAAIAVTGLSTNETAYTAPCCCPAPGDRIVGVRRGDGEIEIHTIDCEELARQDPPQELWVDLKWLANAAETVYAIGRLTLTVRNAPGVLGEITTMIARYEANIANVRFTEREVDFFEILLDIEVSDVRKLAQIQAALRALPDVIAVHRLRGDNPRLTAASAP